MMMKHITSIILILFTTIGCKAQIVPVELADNYRDSETGYPDNIDFLDVNNVFDPYIGIWTGNYSLPNSNSTATIELQIEEFTDDFFGISYDRLRIKYKISSENIVHRDYLNLPDNDPRVLDGGYFLNNGGYYTINYVDDVDCGQFGNVFISFWSDDDQLSIYMAPGQDTVNSAETCPDGTFGQQILPTERIFLERQ